MKTFLIILISLIVIAGSALWYFSDTVSASISKIYSGLTTQNTGLVGYWNFDDCDTCSTATDLSGNGNTGTFQADAAHTANGKIGRGATFDGTGDYIDMGSPASLQLTRALTVSAWIYYNGSSDNKLLVWESASYGIGQGYAGGATNKFMFAVYKNAAWNPASGSTSVQLNTWYFVTGTYDGTIGRIYVNGIQENVSVSVAAPINTGTTFEIGGYVGGDTSNAIIDEVRVYNRALSAAEINTLYNQGSAKFAMKTTVKSANNTGLVAYWNFDDCDTCSTATDRSNNGYTGTLENAVHSTGIIDKAISFDGNGDDVLIASRQALNDITDSGNSVTYAAWINTSSLAATQNFIGKMHTVNNQPLYDPYITTSGKIGLDITNCSTAESYTTTNAVITTGRWYYVTITHTYGTGSSTKVYVNGELVPGSWNITGNLACDSTNTNPLYIGHLEHTGAPGWFNGKLDEVRIYNRALSAAEIKTLYQQGSAKFTIKSANNTGLVGYWNFDDCDTCTTANDLSGNRNHGTFQGNAAHTANGKINRGATFDGTGDYVLVNDSASLDLTSALTVSAWFNLNSLTCTGVDNVGVLASKHNSATTKDGYMLGYVCTDDKMYFQGGDGTTWASLSIASAKTFSETGKWYHVAGTFNGTTGYLYADGELTGSDTSAALSDNNQNFWIGGDVNKNDNFINAKLDEIRIYNRALSAAEIKTLYQSGR